MLRVAERGAWNEKSAPEEWRVPGVERGECPTIIFICSLSLAVALSLSHSLILPLSLSFSLATSLYVLVLNRSSACIRSAATCHRVAGRIRAGTHRRESSCLDRRTIGP